MIHYTRRTTEFVGCLPLRDVALVAFGSNNRRILIEPSIFVGGAPLQQLKEIKENDYETYLVIVKIYKGYGIKIEV